MTSCMDTYYVTKKTTFDGTIRSVQSQLANQGFNSTGSNTNTHNEAIVTGVSYSKYSGFGTAMANLFITQDTYRFADSLGNTLSYSVLYSAKQTSKGESYVEGVEVCGCESSNPKDYERLCGKESTIKQINTISKDLQIERLNVMDTTIAITGIGLMLSLFLVLMALRQH